MEISAFKKILGDANVLTSAEDLAFYGKDSCKEYAAHPSCVLLPKSIAELQAVLKHCSDKRMAVVPSGGRTGYSGAATAASGEVVLSLARMNKILAFDEAQGAIRCEAGVVTARVQEEAKKHGLYYPVDFGSSGSSQIGGNLATNAGGIRVLRYGLTRDQVLGLKAVLADGTLIEWSALVKNQTGYDLRHLLIGSEGTLAVIAEVTLRLHALPSSQSVLLCGLQDLASSLKILSRARSHGLAVSALECFSENAMALVTKHHAVPDPFTNRYPWYALMEIEGSVEDDTLSTLYSELEEQGIVADAALSQNAKQFKELWSLRELISETIAAHHVPHKNDVSVPLSMIPTFVTQLSQFIKKSYPDLQVVIFGHVGDGNLHVNILKSDAEAADKFFSRCRALDREIFSIVQSLNGSISAEHGVGLLKKEFLTYSRSDKEIELMKGIKRIFDPNGILNPGKIFNL